MKEKFRNFMIGRYGVDAFGKFLLGFVIAIWTINFFANSKILYSWGIVLLIYAYYRMFSKNLRSRQQENQKFLKLKTQLANRLRTKKSEMKQRKTHHIYRCPTCRQKIRIPKGKGRICITCPKCKSEFTKIS